MAEPGAPDPTSMAADLRSGDPDRVTHALTVLDQAWRRRPAMPMPMPDAEDLATAFDSAVPQEVVDRFISVVQNYPLFEPPPEPAGRHIAALDAVLLYGPGQPAFDVALSIRVDDHADYAVKDVMRHLLDRPAEDATELAVVEQVLDHLLDGNSTRAAVVEGLVDWAFRGRYPDLVDRLLPQLDEGERARVIEAMD